MRDKQDRVVGPEKRACDSVGRKSLSTLLEMLAQEVARRLAYCEQSSGGNNPAMPPQDAPH